MELTPLENWITIDLSLMLNFIGAFKLLESKLSYLGASGQP